MRHQPATNTVMLLAMMLLMPAVSLAETITTTLPPLAGLVKMVTPDTEVACLLTAGGDPHHFTLSPRQAEGLRQSQLLIRSSRDDGGWKLFTGNITVLDLWPEQDHAWLSPERVEAALPRIAAVLKKLEPQKADQIEARLQQALRKVREIDEAWQATLQKMAVQGVVMQHPSWKHLFESKGVPVHAVLESDKHGHEHGPHALEEAHHTIDEHPHAVLIGDIRHSNRTLEWVAHHQHDNDKPIYLDALGSCGTSWDALMNANLQKLKAQ